MDPVLKYAGSKRWAIAKLAELYAPYRHLRFVEPFVGSMAVSLGLNKSAFNGLCRFSKAGNFNVPFGSYATINYRRDFSEYVSILRRWSIHCLPWEATLAVCGENDFIYADPPYDDTFDGYNADSLSSWEQQMKLAEALAKHLGPVVVSNNATARVLALYRELGFNVSTIEVKRSIGADTRKPAIEMLATKNVRESAGILKGVVA